MLWNWKLLHTRNLNLLARQNSSFETDGLCRYTDAAELLVRQNQKEEKIVLLSFLADMRYSWN